LFWEDIPYGLCILKNLVELLGNFPTPAIDSMIRWHQQFMDKVRWACVWRMSCEHKDGHTWQSLICAL
jgi:hypothetical protein